jgi:hypothetical protein
MLAVDHVDFADDTGRAARARGNEQRLQDRRAK